MKKISIVTPCFNEEDNIRECYETVRDIFADQLPDYEREHLFSDNASTDRTVEILPTREEIYVGLLAVNDIEIGPGSVDLVGQAAGQDLPVVSSQCFEISVESLHPGRCSAPKR